MRRGAKLGTLVFGVPFVGLVVVAALLTLVIAQVSGLSAEQVAHEFGYPSTAAWLRSVGLSVVMVPLMVILYGTLPGAVVGAVVGALRWRRCRADR
jgi:hypothetical protein